MAGLDNKKIASLISETADLMEIAGMDAFRVRSYRNAAAIIEAYPEEILDIAADASRDVTAIKGIGKGIAGVLEEIAAKGTFERREELLEKYPPTALELLKIQGLGPKTIAAIYERYRVSTIDGLEDLAREGKLRELPRMGEKSERNILKGIEAYKRSAGRFLLHFAGRVAQEMVEYLSQVEGVERVTPAGSLRRFKETVGDIDLLVTGSGARRALDRFVEHPSVTDVLGHGEKKASARAGREGIQVDVRALEPKNYGAALLYFTGSKEHNVALRERAVRRGLSLNEYALTRSSSGKKVAAESEEEIYEKLGLRWIPPEMRENNGEIEAAEKDSLPRLVECRDIRCDVHMHTDASDGHFPLEEMAAAARRYGHEFIAITDHSKALAMANGLNEKRLLEQIKQVRKLSKKWQGFTVLSGCEVDILRDGKMDIDDEVLAQLDVVIASVHSYMNLDEQEMTERLLACLENPYVHLLGHPTGRILLRRDAYRYEFETIAGEAARRGVAMEINASPERLDLDASHVQFARSKGIKFLVNTDAHHIRHLENMKYGVGMARRGWLEAADVLNTRKLDAFRKALARKES